MQMTPETIQVLHEVYGHLLRLLPRARQYVGKKYFSNLIIDGRGKRDRNSVNLYLRAILISKAQI